MAQGFCLDGSVCAASDFIQLASTPLSIKRRDNIQLFSDLSLTDPVLLHEKCFSEL